MQSTQSLYSIYHMKDGNDNDKLHLGSKGNNFINAVELRRTSTEAEIALWNRLRNKRLNGYKFRRQHPIKNYVADFYCHEARLIVEADGEIHDEVSIKEYDEKRTCDLKEFGIRVIRFTNRDILNKIDEVLIKINVEIQLSLSIL
jgi:very-short-patch-repair endonuclease